jgi:hypothetical protein
VTRIGSRGFLLIACCRHSLSGDEIYRGTELFLQVNRDRNSNRRQAPPTGEAHLSLQMPGHEDTVAGAKELDFAPQRFDNVKILVNASDIFFEIVFSAGSSSRL